MNTLNDLHNVLCFYLHSTLIFQFFWNALVNLESWYLQWKCLYMVYMYNSQWSHIVCASLSPKFFWSKFWMLFVSTFHIFLQNQWAYFYQTTGRLEASLGQVNILGWPPSKGGGGRGLGNTPGNKHRVDCFKHFLLKQIS